MELPAEVVATMAAQGAAPASGLPALLMPDHSSFAHGAFTMMVVARRYARYQLSLSQHLW